MRGNSKNRLEGLMCSEGGLVDSQQFFIADVCVSQTVWDCGLMSTQRCVRLCWLERERGSEGGRGRGSASHDSARGRQEAHVCSAWQATRMKLDEPDHQKLLALLTPK